MIWNIKLNVFQIYQAIRKETIEKTRKLFGYINSVSFLRIKGKVKYQALESRESQFSRVRQLQHEARH